MRPLDQRLAVLTHKWILLGLAVLECRDNITNPRQSGTLHERPFRLVDNFIDPAGLESARHFQLDERQMTHLLRVDDHRCNELPLIAGDVLTRVGLTLATSHAGGPQAVLGGTITPLIATMR